MPLLLAAGTTLMQGIMFLFRYSMVQWVVKAGIFALIGFLSFSAAYVMLPDWVSVNTIQDKISGFSPAVSYFLDLTYFYDGLPLMVIALTSAWLIKKIPSTTFLGSMFRGK